MKITFDVDCTPEEARQFLGLPDVSELQKEAMEEVRKRMMETIQSSDPETLMKTWMPASMQGFDQMQKMFWSQFSKDSSSKTTK
ncbi:ribosomal protein S1 [Kiloniella litopenaei]|uniref:Ribosomal protein S1 n=1 Tax=Kiloniella litopenaei TaxID=1549748 RepID=A0A0M2RBY4_9PROT|nr:DUF6489 family protein [Kiloniella litopenaei]KKJ77113.1 ribosomal protein S1 [Kiloniella litopenaei]